MRLLCRFLGFQRMVAFVDLLLEDEEHDQAKQCGTGGDQQQVGIVGGSAGCAGDGAACEGVGAEQAADDAMPMDGETFMARSFMPTPRPDSSFSMVPSTVETTGEYMRPQLRRTHMRTGSAPRNRSSRRMPHRSSRGT